MTDVRILRDARAILGEGAVWDPRDGVLWWVDIHGRALHRTDPENGLRDARWDLGAEPGCLSLLHDGTLLIAMRGRVARFDPRTGVTTTLMPVEAARPDHRCNDGRAGPDGAFWFGTMRDGGATGALYRMTADGALDPVHHGIAVPNALCWSPDGRTLYRADSADRCILAHPFDPTTGATGPARTFFDLRALDLPDGSVPDGATTDAEGRIWVAIWDGACVLALTPDGRVERRLHLPVRRPTCPAFGGPGLTTLFITSARIGLEASSGHDGALLAVEVGARGLPERVLSWPS